MTTQFHEEEQLDNNSPSKNNNNANSPSLEDLNVVLNAYSGVIFKSLI